MRKRRERKNDSDFQLPDMLENTTSNYRTLPKSNETKNLDSPYQALDLTQKEAREDLRWIISYGEIQVEKEVGKGAFGVVFKARWRGNNVAGELEVLCNEISVKYLQHMSTEQYIQFKAEAALMAALRPHGTLYQSF